MEIFGLYFKREVKALEELAKIYAYRESEVEKKREINKLKEEYELKIIKLEERYGKGYGDLLLDLLDIERKFKCKQTEIYVLRSILDAETDKEIKRLECIIQRAKKPRIKKKIENRIIDYKMRKIAYKTE